MVKARKEPDVEIPVGNAAKGAKIFKTKCAQCHGVKAAEGSKSGPNLSGIFGSAAGHDAGFPGYSDAIKTSGITWSDKHMFEFVVNPKKYVPGTKMVFAGMKKPQERADLIAFMQQASQE